MANRWGKKRKQWRFIFLGSRITVGSDCSHETLRHLLLKRKAVTNLDSILKSTSLLTGPCSQNYFFPVVMYVCESWTIKMAECWRIDAFELWCWRRLLRVPWTARSNQSILKEINPEYSLEGLMLTLKLQYSGHLMRISHSFFVSLICLLFMCHLLWLYLNLVLLLFLCACLSFCWDYK